MFELNKYYVHTDGRLMYIIGLVETATRGKLALAEYHDGDKWCFTPITVYNMNVCDANWYEISREAWLNKFKERGL